MQTSRANGFHRHAFNRDPMIRPKVEVELEPVRVIVELRSEEFAALSAACGRVAPAVFLRLVALRLAALGEQNQPDHFSHLARRGLLT